MAPLKRLTRFGYGDALAADDRDPSGAVMVFGSNGPFDRHSAANTLGPCIIVGRKGSYGKCQYSEEPVFAVDTTFIVDRRHTEANLRYLFHLLGSLGLDELSDDTAVPGLSREKAYQSLAPLPPPKTQKRIAAFLDEKTTQIDALIEKKRALLDRLAEKRQAIITQAVTKGLNPAVPMKDSGIDWLGEVPAHWETFLIKRKYDVSYGVGGEIDRGLDAGINLLSLPNVSKDGRLILEETQFTGNDDKSLLLKPGDLLFNWRNGSAEHLGKTALFDLSGKWTHVSFLLRIRAIDENASTVFLRYFLNGMRETGFFTSAKAGVNNTFNLFELRNLVVAAPPTKIEQEFISKQIESGVSMIDATVKALDKSISALTEYRSALITAAVTGQIDGLC